MVWQYIFKLLKLSGFYFASLCEIVTKLIFFLCQELMPLGWIFLASLLSGGHPLWDSKCSLVFVHVSIFLFSSSKSLFHIFKHVTLGHSSSLSKRVLTILASLFFPVYYAANCFFPQQCVQPCLTICNPMDCSRPGSSVHGISQARMLKWLAISFSRESSQPRDQTLISYISGGFFTTKPPEIDS